MIDRLFERLNDLFDRVFGPPPCLPKPERPVTTSTTTTTWAGRVTIFCGLCGDAYTADSGWPAAHPECPPCRRAKAIERDQERAGWRRRRDILLRVAERRTDGA